MLQRVSYKDVAIYTWYYWRQNKGLLAVSFGIIGITAFIDTLFPLVTANLIKAVTALQPALDARLETGATMDLTILYWAFALFIGTEVVYHTMRNCSHYVWNAFALRCMTRIINDGFAKVQKFSSNWHANNFAGATVRKLTRGMWSFDTYEDIIFMFLFPTFIVMVSTIVLISIQWPLVGLMTFITTIIYIAVSLLTVFKINAPLFKASADKDTEVGAALADSVTANSVVKAHGSEDREEIRFGGVVNKWSRVTFQAWTIATTTDLARRYVSILMMIAMMGSVLYLWYQGQADAADLVYVFTAFIVLSNYLRNIGEQIANLQKAIAEMEDAIFFWKTDVAVKDKAAARPLQSEAGAIDFDQVTFAYDKGQTPIYDDFTLSIAAGEKVALVGHSGSGKSTFVKLVQRLYDIQKGAIRIDGQDIADVTQASLRRAIALVPQEPILFHRSLADNIAYGRPGASMEEIQEAARLAYADEFIQSLQYGYDTFVGERGVKLSGGERQRVAIARAILSDCPVLILDEATSALDSVSEHYIQKALENLMKGRTSITIAHRLSTIKNVDRILVFDQGQIVEQGTHTQLVGRDTSHYKTLYEMQTLDLVGE